MSDIFEILSKSLEKTSIIWLILSGAIGGGISYTLKFIYDEVIKRKLDKAYDIKKKIDKYSAPLLKSGVSLERHINNFIRNIEKKWFEESDYYRYATLYRFCEFFSWVYILEKEVVYLEYQTTGKTKDFNDKLNHIFKATTSFGYFKRLVSDESKLSESAIPRLLFQSIGESFVSKTDGEYQILSFNDFINSYDELKNTLWMKRLLDFFQDIDSTANTLKWDRLILLGAKLKDFLLLLDQNNLYIENIKYVNTELIKTKGVVSALQPVSRKNKLLN